jgi:ubiquitin C-terminal hydrolase
MSCCLGRECDGCGEFFLHCELEMGDDGYFCERCLKKESEKLDTD